MIGARRRQFSVRTTAIACESELCLWTGRPRATRHSTATAPGPDARRPSARRRVEPRCGGTDCAVLTCTGRLRHSGRSHAAHSTFNSHLAKYEPGHPVDEKRVGLPPGDSMPLNIAISAPVSDQPKACRDVGTLVS